MMDQAFLRCKSCGTVNRLPASKLRYGPKCGKCRTPLEFPKEPVEVTAANFEEEVLRWPGFVLVEFWSYRCGVCSAILPFIRNLALRKAGILKVAMIDVEREFFLAERFDIRSTPVFLVYRNGVKVEELYGALPRLQMESWIKSVTGG